MLYLASSALDSRVVAWAQYDGTAREQHQAGDSDTPPYGSGLEALQDGWRLFQVSQLSPPDPDHPFTLSYLRYECWFEKLDSSDD